MTPAVRILEPGLLSTIQDLGRIGYQHLGVTTSGALDPISLRAANALVGNELNTGVLEAAYVGPTFVVEADSVNLACVGADASIEVLVGESATTGVRYPSMQSFRARRGEVIRIGSLSRFSVIYLAVEGGFDIDPVLGSVSTFIRGGIGGWQGRPLVAGDALPLRRESAAENDAFRLEHFDLERPSRFRVILGPQNSHFSERSIRNFLDAEYLIKPATDRMAVHLDGPKLDHVSGHDIVSDGIALGSIQVSGNGKPIVLMADRQTTGGYPKVATVISADIAALGRARIGDTISFHEVTIEEAQHLRRTMLREIDTIPARVVRARNRDPEELTTHLLMNNLISGATNATFPHVVD